MLVYQGVKSSFIEDVDLGKIANKIREKYIEVIHRRPPAQEFNSWRQSMQYMRGVLSDNDIPNNVGIAIEYNIPPTGCRIDFLISGYSSDGSHEAVIIELKQWEKCDEVDNVDGIYKVNTYTGHGYRDVNHPSYQAITYANLIRDYNANVEDKLINVRPCAYLHNYYFSENDPLLNDKCKEYVKEAPIFSAEDVIKLRNFIKKYIRVGDNKEVLYEIDSGKIRPSKMLQDSLVSMLKGNQEFYMIDKQNIVFEYAIAAAIDTVASNSKNVFIVKGGPGTGKSVLAVNLLVELNKRGMTSFYVTKNTAPRNVYSKKLKGSYTKKDIDHLFQSSGNFIDEENNAIDCLIVDEAHRLTGKTLRGRYFVGENQVKEIIRAAKLSIFFLDEDQQVTLQDIGNEEEITKFAKEFDAGIYTYELDSQFRCNGSDGYIAWLDNILEIRETANYDLEGFDYEFKVFDDPNEMRKAIEEKNKINNKSRIVAGYCWEWPKGNRRNPNFHDIVIPEYNFEMSWNLEGGELFAIGEDTVKQAGCIHTTQGLEFDYIGIIIGPDMRYENGHVITDYTKRAKSDQSLKGIGKYSDEEKIKISNRIIKNTYRTLMTRAMKGCYIFCTDKNLQEYLKGKLKELKRI